MSVSDTSSFSITKGKRYSENEDLGWASLDERFSYDADIEDGGEAEAVEGGPRAWLTVIGSSLVYFATFGIINSFGFFQSYYATNSLHGVPASTISFVGTLQITLMNVLAAPAGALFDCHGLNVRINFINTHGDGLPEHS